ncbi:S-layer homology domain-containing protein [Evtepia sp.]|uniref:S-layer homology domain-containing protein n=1 Tax=Evtepia sp. TaxID=2773933 RepID=UPI00399BABF0
MDGDQDKLDCNGASHAIDGWYDDSEGSRWNAHSVPTHVDEFTVGSAAVHDLLALKAAHDVIPLEPDDPDLPDYDAGHSKSKTATNLEKQEDETYTSEVTLSLPSAEVNPKSDVVFVLDRSSSMEDKGIRTQINAMLEELADLVAEHPSASIKVGVVGFDYEADTIIELTELTSDNLGDIQAAVDDTTISGTNVEAGIVAGAAMLASDATVDNDNKYLVLVTDGISHAWNDTDGTAMTLWGAGIADTKTVFNGANSYVYFDTTKDKFGSIYALPADADALNSGKEVPVYAENGAEYTVTLENSDEYIDSDEYNTYLSGVEKGVYTAAQAYADAASKYKCISVYWTSRNYPVAQEFMEWTDSLGKAYNLDADGATVESVFNDVMTDIYYLLDEGTTVKDYMGYVADDYNFDFVANGLTMKVGEVEYVAEQIGDNKYGFAPSETLESGYAYTLTYVPGDQKGGEHFVWEINVPVSNFAPVQLTYTVKLVNPKTTEGTYGVYDSNGDGLDDVTGGELTGNTGLYTNNSATLYPVDSNNTEGLPENFPKPTVSYTVAQETGTLTVQKIVADNVEDWSFDFAVTIGGNTQNVTLTKNSPTWTSGPIALGTEYEVKEVDAKGYQVTSTNETGTITENSSAVFVNMPVDTGVLTISKTVEGQKNPTEKFTFTVNLPEGEYPYIYSTAQGNNEVSGYISDSGTVTLSSGQSVSIYGLPVSESYTVTETESDDYTVSAEAIHGTVDGAVVSGTIPDLDDGAAAAHYTNTYHGSWIPPVDPDPTPDPDPGDKPELNTEDHYAYIVGYEDGSVQPEGDITRAEVATIFFRLLTDESRDEFWSQTNDYTDVPADAWYNNAVSTLSNAGIIDGYEDGTFKPDGNITRAEFATIAVRFFEATYDGGDLFSDIAGHWAQDYINEAANAGIVDGYPDGTFRPQQYITRAEAMTMVNRTIDRHPDADHLLEDMITWPDNPETAWYYEQVQEATNSHEYTMNTDDEQNPYEIWTELLPNRDWSELEKAWSDANDGAGSGEVV